MIIEKRFEKIKPALWLPVVLFLFSLPFLAQASVYQPNATLNPDCAPNTSNCGVAAPASTGANSNITSLSGLTTPLPASEGGTGLSSAGLDGQILMSSSGALAWSNLDTGKVSENGALYFTPARARGAISSTALGLTYDSATGIFSLASGYEITKTASSSQWNSWKQYIPNIPTIASSSQWNITAHTAIPTTASTTQWDSWKNYIPNIPTVASSTQWNNFYHNPSLIIATSSNLQWTGKTLGVMPGYSIPSTASTTDWNNAKNNQLTLKSFSSSLAGLSYDNTTGIFSAQSGYAIPSSTAVSEWSAFYQNPSSRIEAGVNCSWSGNIFNCTGGDSGSSTPETIYGATGDLLQLQGTDFSVKTGTLADGKGCTYSAGTGLVCNSDIVGLSSFSSSATGLNYNNTTGQFSFDSNYNLPLVASTTQWNNYKNLINNIPTTASTTQWNSYKNYIAAIPAVASSTQWNNFYHNPSSIISAAGNLAWNGNSIGVASNYSIPLTASSTQWNGYKNSISNIPTSASTTQWNGYKNSIATIPAVASTTQWNNYKNSIAAIPTVASTTQWNNLKNSSLSNSLPSGDVLAGNSSGVAAATSTIFLKNGNVGIGTTNPVANLNITETGGDTGPSASVKGVFALSYTGVGLAAGLYNSSPYAAWLQGMDTRTNQATTFPISLNPIGGNVGIGTTNPTAKLQVNGAIIIGGPGLAGNLQLGAPTGNAGAKIDFLGWAGSYHNWQIDTAFTGGNGLNFVPSTAVGGSTFTTPAMTIADSGYVGIGTTNPASTLDVYSNYNSINESLKDKASGNTIFDIRTTTSGYSNTQYRSFAPSAGNAVMYSAIAGTDANTAAYLAFGINPNSWSTNGTGFMQTAFVDSATNGAPLLPLTFSIQEVPAVYIATSRNVGIGGTKNPLAHLEISPNVGDSTDLFRISSTTSGDVMAVNKSGNIGIGTSVPSAKLEINTGAIGTVGQKIEAVSGQTANFAEYWDAAHTLGLPLVYISKNGIGGLITSMSNNPADPTAGISQGANFGLNGSTNNFFGIGLGALRNTKYDMWFQTGAATGGGYRWYEGTTENMTMDSSGNVGIGSTVPAAVLDITRAGADGSLIQQWQYTSNYQLKLKQDVSSGLVKWTFDQKNNGTDYANVLTFDRGNVGIGTTDPTQKLEIDGNALIKSDQSYNASYNPAFNGQVRITSNNNAASLTLESGTNSRLLKIQVGHSGDGLATKYPSVTGNISLNPIGGNVGIGITNPFGLLSLNNQIGQDNVLSYAGVSNAAGQAIINSYYIGATDGMGPYPRYLDIASVGEPDGTNGGGNIRFLTNPITLNSPAVERMRINSQGYVGIGTTNPSSLFEVANLIKFNNTDFNTQIGYQTGANLVAGAAYNTFLGYQAGVGSPSGGTSAAILNVGIGAQTLQYNKTGAGNLAIGAQTLNTNDSGSYNVALGYHSMVANSTGSYNVGLGFQSMQGVQTGSNNFAMGAYSMSSNTSGASNVGLGFGTLYYNTDGSENISLGDHSMFTSNSSYNIGIGAYSLYAAGSSVGNIAIGAYALENTTGSSNVGMGTNVGLSLTTGAYNTFIGYYSGYNVSQKIDAQNSTAIGNGAYTTASNQVVIGNSSVTQTLLNGNVGIGTTGPAQKFEVQGLEGSPAVNGTTQNGMVRIDNATHNQTLDIGQLGTAPWSSWLQAGDKAALETHYPLVLNPSGGFVGVGLPDPQYPLDVYGDIHGNGSLVNTYYGSDIVLYGVGSRIYNQDKSAGWNMQLGATGDFDFWNLDSGNWTRPITFQHATGYVSIGTTSPATKLDIYDSSSGPIITLAGLNTNYRGLTIKDISNNEQWFSGANNHDNFVIRRSGTTDNFTIASSTGNIGIGTSAPATALDVNGSVTLESGTTGTILCLTSNKVIGHCTSDAVCVGTCTCTCVAN